jgi:hypothetical protein
LTVTDALGASAQVQLRAVARYEFVDNGDGTVTNRQTGLVWQQFDDGNLYLMAEAVGRSFLGIRDENNGLSVCDSLVLAGHDDWRTPRLWEVESLRDFTFDPPRIDHAVFPGVTTSPLMSDSYSPNSQGNFVEFEQGMVLRRSLMQSRYPLHCVRP